MSEEAKNEINDKITSCFSYEVTMVVQVLATSREEADKQLDSQGGFLSSRQVSLVDVVTLYDGKSGATN